MHNSILGSTNDVYPKAVAQVLALGDDVPIDRPEAVGRNTLEVHPAFLNIVTPNQPLVTSFGRPINVAFALAEVLWILGGRNDVALVEGYNSTISQFSDDGVRFNAAYGDRMRKAFGVDQLEDIIRTLRDDPSSRQATIVISNPVDDKGWDRLPSMNGGVGDWHYSKHQTKDRACNLVAHAMIRDGMLDWMQVLRSNDIIWGTPFNFMQWMHVQNYVAAALGIQANRFTFIADSLHMYQHHWQEAQAISVFDLYEFCPPHAEMATGDAVINVLLCEEQIIREARADGYSEIPPEVVGQVGDYWKSVLCVLKAHREYREGRDREAWVWLTRAEPVYRWAQARFYWYNRWHKDAHGHLCEMIRSVAPDPVWLWITDMRADCHTIPKD